MKIKDKIKLIKKLGYWHARKKGESVEDLLLRVSEIDLKLKQQSINMIAANKGGIK